MDVKSYSFKHVVHTDGTVFYIHGTEIKSCSQKEFDRMTKELNKEERLKSVKFTMQVEGTYYYIPLNMVDEINRVIAIEKNLERKIALKQRYIVEKNEVLNG